VKRDAWLERAKATGKGTHSTLKETLHGSGFTFCVDGVRAHLWHCQDEANGESAKLAEMVQLHLETRPTLTFEVTALALVAACNMALALRQSPRDEQHLYLSPNGSLKFHSENPTVGDVSGEFVDGDKWRRWKRDPKYKIIPLNRDASIPLHYRHEGAEAEFAVNPKYIKDALAVFDETDTVRVSLRGHVVVMEPVTKDEEWPQAVVMTINTERGHDD